MRVVEDVLSGSHLHDSCVKKPLCCTPRTIDMKPCEMVVKRLCHDHWMGRLGKVSTHANRMLHMYVCASAPAPRPSQKPLHDTFLCS